MVRASVAVSLSRIRVQLILFSSLAVNTTPGGCFTDGSGADIVYPSAEHATTRASNDIGLVCTLAGASTSEADAAAFHASFVPPPALLAAAVAAGAKRRDRKSAAVASAM